MNNINSDYEVGFRQDDKNYYNDQRLPGSVNSAPVMGSIPTNYIKPTPLDAGDTGGVVGIPTMQDNYGMEGTHAPSLNPHVDVTNSDTTLMATASEENRSWKWKNGEGLKRETGIHPKGSEKVQYNDHT